jgi:hypothetical protein
MNKCLFICVMTLMVFPLFAQEETLVNDHFHAGGYGGPVWKIGLINGQVSLFSGGRGAWIINHTIAIGGGGYSTFMDVDIDGFSDNDKPLFLGLYYGGFGMEYIWNSDKVIHWTIHTLIGAGSAKLKEHAPDVTLQSERFYLVEPSFNIDVNITKWFRFGVGASYRLTFGLEMDEISSSDLSGPGGQIILKFGYF